MSISIGVEMGLTEDEKAFYDALAANDSALQAMGDDKLRLIAAELISQVKKSVTIDWNLRESARARIKVTVKRILNKYGYPPDLQEDAVKTCWRRRSCRVRSGCEDQSDTLQRSIYLQSPASPHQMKRARS